MCRPPAWVELAFCPPAAKPPALVLSASGLNTEPSRTQARLNARVRQRRLGAVSPT